MNCLVAQVPGFLGFLGFFGSLDLRVLGAWVLWVPWSWVLGSLLPWILESLGPWGPWVPGSWVLGCLGPWVLRSLGRWSLVPAILQLVLFQAIRLLSNLPGGATREYKGVAGCKPNRVASGESWLAMPALKRKPHRSEHPFCQKNRKQTNMFSVCLNKSNQTKIMSGVASYFHIVVLWLIEFIAPQL